MCKNTKLEATNTSKSTGTSASSPSSSNNGNLPSTNLKGTNTMNNDDETRTSSCASALSPTSTSSEQVSLPSSSSPLIVPPPQVSPISPPPMSLAKKITKTLLWMALTYISKEFSKFLAINQSSAAKATFVPASYSYDQQNTFFDNTFLTYGTDFFIGIFMTYASYQCFHEGRMALSSSSSSSSSPPSSPLDAQSETNVVFHLGFKSSALFASYAVSVFSGAIAHYTFHDVESMNTLSFRFWWTLCVGTVTIAGGFMGMCGSDICNFFDDGNTMRNTIDSSGAAAAAGALKQRRFGNVIGYVNIGLWWYYGLFMTVVCIMGEISYKRPACDIFVAGTGQFVPTMYCVFVLMSIRWHDAIPGLEAPTASSDSMNSTTSDSPSTSARSNAVHISRRVRTIYYIGFALNCYLLPGYPLLVQYTNLSLGVINALLHLNLTFAWGMQAWSLCSICATVRKSTSSSARSDYVLVHGQGVGGVGDACSIGLQVKKTL